VKKILDFKNNLHLIKSKKVSIINKYSKSFNKIFLELKKDLKNKKKTLNVLDNNFLFNFKISELKRFQKFKTIAIVGMGGSILGSEAIYSFLDNKIKKKIYFFNNINENEILNFKKEQKNLSKILFIIISKSGNTIETLSNIFSLNILKKDSKNIIIISEKSNFLFNLSKKLNLFHIEHNNFIGGRYSVLSETGMIPSYLMGVNIRNLRSKLLDFLKIDKLFLKESSIQLSNFLITAKYNNLIFLNYHPKLEKFLFWCQQLIAESLGKKNKGFLPVISNVPKDHHSLLQLYLDGPKDKIFYIFSAEIKSKIKINLNEFKKEKKFLEKRLLSSVKNAQKNALIKSLLKNKIPFREFKIKKINEETIGKLFSYFILETIIIGKLSKINPFNQPAVEQVKNYTKDQLIKKTKNNF
tara:strand:+ start:1887 stop:3122 length:1236 start_codon:yes stop_codon:yes gene_type:complete